MSVEALRFRQERLRLIHSVTRANYGSRSEWVHGPVTVYVFQSRMWDVVKRYRGEETKAESLVDKCVQVEPEERDSELFYLEAVMEA